MPRPLHGSTWRDDFLFFIFGGRSFLTGCMRAQLVPRSYAGCRGSCLSWMPMNNIVPKGRKLKMQGYNLQQRGTDLKRLEFFFTLLCSKFSQICHSWVWTELRCAGNNNPGSAASSLYLAPSYYYFLARAEAGLHEIQMLNMPNWLYMLRKMQLCRIRKSEGFFVRRWWMSRGAFCDLWATPRWEAGNLRLLVSWIQLYNRNHDEDARLAAAERALHCVCFKKLHLRLVLQPSPFINLKFAAA